MRTGPIATCSASTSSTRRRARPRQRFEAVARFIRDLLAQRWVKTRQTREAANPKRVYYLSMEFLIGRTLRNNIMNLSLEPLVDARAAPRRAGTLAELAGSRSPTPGWATAAWAGWPPASSTRWPRCSTRRWATACATSTASSGRRSATATRSSSRTTGCASPIRGRSSRPGKEYEVPLNASFELRGSTIRDHPEPAVDASRHRLRSAGRRLRRAVRQHAAALGGRRSEVVRLRRVLARRLRRRRDRQRRRRVAHPRPLPGRLHRGGPDAALPAGVFPGQLLAAGHRRRAFAKGGNELAGSARQGGDPAQRHASRAGRRRADADPARPGAARTGTRPGT